MWFSPLENGTRILAHTFVDSDRLTRIVGDLEVSGEGFTIRTPFPWPLIIGKTSNSYQVRLILYKCVDKGGKLLCGSETCPCMDVEDCNKVEAEKEVTGTLNDALNMLTHPCLSYFYSDRAWKDGIWDRGEISKEYWAIRGELRGQLLKLETKDEKRLEKIRTLREKKRREAHQSLKEQVLEYYRDELPLKVKKIGGLSLDGRKRRKYQRAG